MASISDTINKVKSPLVILARSSICAVTRNLYIRELTYEEALLHSKIKCFFIIII